MKRCIATLLVAVLLIGLLPVMSAQASTQYATVVGGWLRLRSGASFNATTIASYYTGTEIKLLGSTGNWYKVQTPDGRQGYMYADFLSVGGTVSGSTNATVISGNGYGVRLRRGPSTSYSVIGKYPVGTRAQILQSGNYWCRIAINGTTGYMMTEFLSKDGTTTPTYEGDAVIWSGNGYGVRLRTGPSKSYSKIGTYSVGTPVKVLKKGAVWDYIQIGSRVGYMMNEFLIYNQNNSISAVTINNMKPVIGNILAIRTVDPSAATVTYEWMRKDADGNVSVVGTNASYTVTASDAGCTLQLKVTGRGSYTGTAVSGYTSKVENSRILNGVTLDNLSPVIGDKLTPTVDPADATYNCTWEVNGKTYTGNAYTVSEADKGYPVKLTVKGSGAFEGSEVTVETSAVLEKGTVSSVVIVNETSSAGSAPNVGDKLSAQLVPSTATVAYVWNVMNGSTVVKTITDPTLPVVSDYDGCIIQRRVVGTGNYTGEATASTEAVSNRTQLTGVTINGDAQPVYKNGTGSTLTAKAAPEGATAEYKWFAGETEVGTGDTYTITAADSGKTITVKASGTGNYCGSATSTATAAVALAHTSYEAKASGTNIVGYDYAVEFVGDGTEPSTWTLTANIPGMTVSGSKISGKPTAAGEYKINLKVSNAAGEVAFGDYTVTILPEQVKPVVTAPSQTTFYVGEAVGSVAFSATEGPINSWTVEGTLCPGLSLDTATGVLGGTPSVAGEYTITVKAKNKAGESDGAAYTFKVVEKLSINGYNTEYTFESGSDVQLNLTAAGGSGAYSWVVSPDDSFQISGGVVTAIDPALADGTYVITVTAADAADATLTRTTENITITIASAPAQTQQEQPQVSDVEIGYLEAYSFLPDQLVTMTLTADGGSGYYLWTLPEVEGFDNSLFQVDEYGVVTALGTLEAGSYEICVTVTDAQDTSRSFTTEVITVTIAAAESVPEESSLEDATEGTEGEEEYLPDEEGAGEELPGEETGE